MDLEVSTPISAEAEVKAYTLVGDDIYVKRYTNENIPDWYRQLISDIIAQDNTITDLDAAVDYLSTLPAGYDQKITELRVADTTITTSLESLVATTGSHTAAIASLNTTKVDATSAAAIARDTVGAYFADGTAGAWFNNQISTYASDITANAMDISTLSATLDGQSVRIDTVESVNISQASVIDNLTTTVNALSTDVGVSIAELQAQIDGSISTYFYDYAPTLENLPASGWLTTTDKLAHVGDLFYDKSTGYGYRFAYEDIVDDPDMGVIFSWIRITDTDVVAALTNAATAQATADGKRTVFYGNITPVPRVENGVTIPIEIGDLWVNSDTKVTKVAVAVSPSVVWGDITNTDTENTLLAISVLEETNDGVINTFYQTTAPTSGMSYGDWWIDTDATPTKIAYRYEDIDGKNVGILAWRDESNSILGKAMITADAKSQIFYSAAAPTIASHPLLDTGDQWVNTADGVVKVWNGTAWVDVVAKSTAEVMQQLADLEEARDGNVVVFYYTNTNSASGMTYGDYLVDTDSWSGSMYTVYRYENSVGGSTGTLAWYVNTGDTARALSAGYRAQVLAGTAQATADGKVKTWYQTSEPGYGTSPGSLWTTEEKLEYVGDIWIDTDNANKMQVWSGSAWVDPTSAQGTQAYTWSATASKLITNPNGGITGWSFADSSQNSSLPVDPTSQFRITADLFELVASSQTAAAKKPFTVNAATGNITFNGIVDFTDTNSLGTTTIDGGKITTGSITTAQLNATDIKAGNIFVDNTLRSSDFTTIGGAGFRLKSNAAGTSTDPTIYGAYIKGSVVDADSIVSGSLTDTYFETRSGLSCDDSYIHTLVDKNNSNSNGTATLVFVKCWVQNGAGGGITAKVGILVSDWNYGASTANTARDDLLGWYNGESNPYLEYQPATIGDGNVRNTLMVLLPPEDKNIRLKVMIPNTDGYGVVGYSLAIVNLKK